MCSCFALSADKRLLKGTRKKKVRVAWPVGPGHLDAVLVAAHVNASSRQLVGPMLLTLETASSGSLSRIPTERAEHNIGCPCSKLHLRWRSRRHVQRGYVEG